MWASADDRVKGQSFFSSFLITPLSQSPDAQGAFHL